MNDEFYIVEFQTDGFGNDTVVDSIWKTKEEAEKYLKDKDWTDDYCTIIKGSFGHQIELAYN